MIQRYWHNSRLTSEIWRSVDIAVLLVVLVGVFPLANPEFAEPGLEFLTVRVTATNVFLLCLCIVVWPMIFSSFGLYDPTQLTSPRSEALRIIGACTVVSATPVLFMITGEGTAFGWTTILLFLLFTVVGTLGLRHVFRVLLVMREGTLPRQILIVGSGPRALKLYRDLMSDPRPLHEVVGFVDSASPDIEVPEEVRERTLGGLDELEDVLMKHRVDEVLIALPIRSCYERIQQSIATCEKIGIESRYLADVFECSLARPEYQQSASVPVIALKVVQDDLRLIFKRCIDIVAATAGLIVLSPVFVLIAVLIKLTSPGPIIFAQERYGYKRRLFKMYKFRTMVANAEALQISLEHLNEARGPVFKIREDPRITPIGKILRRTSLDELPQLINVLKGDMSLVGPRPLPTRDVSHFKDAWLMRRFSVRPGLTCLWQVSGRSNLGFDDWVTLDLAYIDQWSLSLDFRILLMTIPAVFKGTGAA